MIFALFENDVRAVADQHFPIKNKNTIMISVIFGLRFFCKKVNNNSSVILTANLHLNQFAELTNRGL